jgi:folate-binding protein YgfZ
VGAEAVVAARIEAVYPIFGVDMTADTIPLEAGIEPRAISTTKGCYVGQEVIIRVLHRGHGRVARKLVRLQFEGEGVEPRAKVMNGDRESGFVTSVALSPTSGPIALAYVHRDLAVADARVEVETAAGRVAATVLVQPIR